MKRFIAYISVCLAMLVAILVGVAPTILQINGTSDYEQSKQYVYKISQKNYDSNNLDGTNNGYEDLNDESRQEILDEVVETFETRLNNANITDYSLKTSGFDTIKINLKTEETLYDDISSYLTNSWSYMASTFDGDPLVGQTPKEIQESSGNANFFKAGSARVEFRNNYPFVVFDLADPEAFNTVYQDAKKTEDEKNIKSKSFGSIQTLEDGEGESTTKETNKIYILNNWVEGLDIKTLLSSEGNPNLTPKQVKEHIITSFDATKPDSFFWNYDDTLSKEDQEKVVHEQIFFGTYNVANTEDNSIYDTVEQNRVTAYKKANIWANKFNSSVLEHGITLINQSGNNAFGDSIPPNYEYLVFMNQIQWTNTLYISALIAIVVVSLFYALNYGMSSLVGIVTNLGILVVSLGLFNAFGAEFNIGAILALFVIIAVSIFSQTIFFKKIRNELYLGKNIKKAFQEGNRKSTWHLIDFSVIALILGVIAYLIPNTILNSFGALLIVGAILNVLLNGVVLRITAWLLYNSSYVLNHKKVISVDDKFIPNLANDEKPTYFDNFKKVGVKNNKILLIIGAILLIGSIASITTSQIIRGNIYNYSAQKQGSEIVLRFDETNVTESDVAQIETYVETIKNTLQTKVFTLENKALFKDVEVEEYSYSYLINKVTNKEYYFNIPLNSKLNIDDKIRIENSSGNIVEVTLSEGIDSVIRSELTKVDYIAINDIYLNVNDYNNYYSLIFSSIAIGIISIYLLFRFGIAKTILSILFIGGSLLITVGLFSIINGPFLSVITLGVLFLTMFGYMSICSYFIEEKQIMSENKRELTTLDAKMEAFSEGVNLTYLHVVNSTLLVAFMIISMFFTTSVNQYLIILIIIGMVIVTIFFNGLLLPLEMKISKLVELVQTKFKNRVRKEKKNKKESNKSDGPEEAVFIGIND